MLQIRPGVFETNSSSTHSICIATDRKEPLKLQDRLWFATGDYGWAWEKLTDPEEKASYLYSAILELYERNKAEELKNRIVDILASAGVTCGFSKARYHDYGGRLYCENASVDHGDDGELKDFVDKTVHNKGRLMRFLFSPKSFVLTGNDNDFDDRDRSVDIHADYPHEEYYKGN